MSKADEAFGPPAGGGSENYLRMQDLESYPESEAVVRILDLPALTGWERWTKPDSEHKKGLPVRWALGGAWPDHEWRTKTDGSEESARRFWAMWVWDYHYARIKCWVFTQKSIINALRKLHEKEKWGSATGYDISVSREGSGLETEYTVLPQDKGPIAPDILVAWKRHSETAAGLSALFTGGDPFAVGKAGAPADDSDIPF